MRGKNFGSVATPVQALGRTGASGPTFIGREYLYASTTRTVPAGCGRVEARCVGGGGTNYGVNYGGGGGAYARDSLPCSPGQTITVTIPAAPAVNSSTNGSATVVSVNGGTVNAAGGLAAITGGAAANSIGSVRRSGGNGSSSGGSASAGASGGAAGTGNNAGNNSNAGGGSAGDMGDADSLNLGGNGAGAGGSTGVPGGYGGGGAVNGAGAIRPLSGIAVIEYWSY